MAASLTRAGVGVRVVPSRPSASCLLLVEAAGPRPWTARHYPVSSWAGVARLGSLTVLGGWGSEGRSYFSKALGPQEGKGTILGNMGGVGTMGWSGPPAWGLVTSSPFSLSAHPTLTGAAERWAERAQTLGQ